MTGNSQNPSTIHPQRINYGSVVGMGTARSGLDIGIPTPHYMDGIRLASTRLA